jgi:hypothetical protein
MIADIHPCAKPNSPRRVRHSETPDPPQLEESDTVNRTRIKAAILSMAVPTVLALSISIADATDSSNIIPDLSAGGAGWRNTHNDFILPASGPGPVTWDPAHPFVGNGGGGIVTSRVADLRNPILMPWVRDALKKLNDDALSGTNPYTLLKRRRK